LVEVGRIELPSKLTTAKSVFVA